MSRMMAAGALSEVEAQGLTERMTLMRARTDVYGQGLQWALGVESRSGIPGVIDPNPFPFAYVQNAAFSALDQQTRSIISAYART